MLASSVPLTVCRRKEHELALNDLGAERAEVEGRYAEARTLTEEGLALFQSLGDVWGICYALRRVARRRAGESGNIRKNPFPVVSPIVLSGRGDHHGWQYPA